MDFCKSIFTISLFLLSWANQGISEETQSMDQLAKSVEGVAGLLQQAQQQSVAATAAAAQAGAGASPEALPCVQKLIPCQMYMRSSSPPPTCCTPLQDVIKTDSQCLCKLFNNPDILKGFNITLDEAMALPKNCAIDADVSVCKNATAPTATPTTPSTPSNSSSSGSDSSGSSGNSNAGVRMTHAAAAFPYWFTTSVAALMYSAF